MIKQFEILPHTADVRLKVFGKTKEKLFKNALLGMAEILKSQIFLKDKPTGQANLKSQNLLKTKISVKSPDINSLLVDFLSEVLYRSQINKAIYREAKFLKFGDVGLKAEISGFQIDSFDEDIKAVTYHELEIKKSPTGEIFETIIVFDV